LAKPYATLGVNVVAAESDEEARFLATSGRESFINLRRGMPTTLPPRNRAYKKKVLSFGTVPLEKATSVAMLRPTEMFRPSDCGTRVSGDAQ
jgi:alkanesulfonate monooxygenase SsuD/methylene tetrahydromethanopterin reductase-like flavin-dependent oxidoreductase (luciferase family)